MVAAAAAGAAPSRNSEATWSPASRAAQGRRSPGVPPAVVLTPARPLPGPRRVNAQLSLGRGGYEPILAQAQALARFRLGRHRTPGTRPPLLDGSLCWASDEKQEPNPID